jgi:beta-galactosidase GanA
MLISRLLVAAAFCAAGFCAGQTAPLPQIRPNGAVRQLFVDNKPFILLAGELHNSSASSVEYMKPVWDKLAAMHLNTVIGTVSWELIEPVEGQFDFTLVDAQIREARQRRMQLILIWFATWKNAGSSYVPYWVKADRKRFPPMASGKRSGGGMAMLAGYMERQGIGPLSALGEATLQADARAFRALMRHIREVDPQHTVIMMQVENEAGILGDSRDRSALAEEAWRKPVPAELTGYLARNKATLLPEMQEVWGRNGYKVSGTWSEVFGTDEWADEVFMAYHVGRFMGEVAKAGKAELNIPMFANAWLGPQPGQALPGQYPSGGPVARVMDVYRAAAPALDVIAPDIYVEDFKGTCALYARSGNPLLIPEARDQVGNLFWALGQHAGWAWSPFGIEDLNPEGQVAQAYQALSEVLPQLAEWQAAGKVKGILVIDGQKQEPVSLGGYKITLSKGRGLAGDDGKAKLNTDAELPGAVALGSRAMPDDVRPFALVVNTGPDEFLFIGANGDPAFEVDSPGPARVAMASRDQGRFEKGKWVAGRRINGDELFVPGLPNKKIGMLRVRLVRFE